MSIWGTTPAVKPVVAETTVKPTTIKSEMLPGCCALKIVHKLASLGKTDELSKQDAKGFDEKVNTGKADTGNWNTYGKAVETIAIISTSSRYHANDPEQKEFKQQVKFLTAKGWIELCSWKSLESGGQNYMWGSPGIKKS